MSAKLDLKRPYQSWTDCVMDTWHPEFVFDEMGWRDQCGNYNRRFCRAGKLMNVANGNLGGRSS